MTIPLNSPLFHQIKATTKHFSPAAVFDPVSGDFKSTNLDAKEPEKKVIVLSQNAFVGINETEITSAILKIADDGFNVLLKNQYNKFDVLAERINYFKKNPKRGFGTVETPAESVGKEVIWALKHGHSFDDTTDYKTLAALGHARDNLLVVAKLRPEEQQNIIRNSATQKNLSTHRSGFHDRYDPSQYELLRDPSHAREEIGNVIQDRLDPVAHSKNNAELVAQTLTKGDKNILVIANHSLESHANLLFEESAKSNRPVFYIDGPEKIDLTKVRPVISKNGRVTLKQGGEFAAFLESCNSAGSRPLLLINWEKFNSKQKLALNTVIDLERKVGNVAIPDTVQVVGLSGSTDDHSFLLRHDFTTKSGIDFAEIIPDQVEGSVFQTIDLQNNADWKSQLFGKISLQGDKLLWQQSDFVKGLQQGQNSFKIENLSPQAAQELQHEINQAKAKGKFIYHGYEIKLPRDLKINFSRAALNFGKFRDSAKIAVSENYTLSSADAGANIINPQLFDRLLHLGNVTPDGKYQENPGLIAQAANKSDKKLELCITANLSDEQWYYLFSEALKRDIVLELKVAPNVTLPSAVATSTLAVHSSSAAPKLATKIIVSNDVNKTAQEITTADTYAVLDVEDYTCQDLLGKTVFETTKNGFSNFKKIPSQFEQELKSGKKIILKGSFAPELLQMLEPTLLAAGDNLTLIVEDKTCQAGKVVYPPLQWLSKSNYKIHPQPEKTGNHRPLHFNEVPISNNIQDQDSEQVAKAFIDARKKVVTSELQKNSLLQLVGHSGVGKSRLMKILEEDKALNIKLYRELNDFESWANDKSSKTKILFVDESNIEDSQLTFFSPLKNGGNKRVFYQGKFFDLSPKHKVVFACNPKEYGGGRIYQKLFDDGNIPAIELRDFPACYIYEEILKAAIYRGKTVHTFSEQQFEKECLSLIIEYKNQNNSDQENNKETVRELQERLLLRLLSPVQKTQPNIKTDTFVSTSSTAEVELQLSQSLEIRSLQRDGTFPPGIGLNGVLLEGQSGSGKSELIRAVLSNKKITERKLSDKSVTAKQQYYKIEASQSLEEKTKIITKAYEEGNIVWIDELNSCIDDGLEKILNKALTGDHPTGKNNVAAKAGFMLVASINSMDLAGRSQISKAIKHRTIQPKVKMLDEYKKEDLTKIVRSWFENIDHKDVVDRMRNRINNCPTENINDRIDKPIISMEQTFFAQEIRKKTEESFRKQYTEKNKSLTLAALRDKVDNVYLKKNYSPNAQGFFYDSQKDEAKNRSKKRSDEDDTQHRARLIRDLVDYTCSEAITSQVFTETVSAIKAAKANFNTKHHSQGLSPEFIEKVSEDIALRVTNLRAVKENLAEITSLYYCLYDKYPLDPRVKFTAKTPKETPVQQTNWANENVENNISSTLQINEVIPVTTKENLTFFRPQFQLNENQQNSSQFDFSTTAPEIARNPQTKSKDIIIESLRAAAAEIGIREDQVAAIIIIAIHNGGIGANKATESLTANHLAKLDDGLTLAQARKFSAAFQQKMQDAKMFTGNTNLDPSRSQIDFGMRLKRLTPNYILEMLGGDEQKFEKLQEDLGIEMTDLIKPVEVVRDNISSQFVREQNQNNYRK